MLILVSQNLKTLYNLIFKLNLIFNYLTVVIPECSLFCLPPEVPVRSANLLPQAGGLVHVEAVFALKTHVCCRFAWSLGYK